MAATLRKRGKRYIVTVHQDGKRKQQTFSVKKEAERAKNLANNALKSGGKVVTVARSNTLNHFIDRWFALVVNDEEDPHAYGTRVRYEGIHRNKIVNGIGKWDINKLTRPALIEYFQDLKIAGHTRSDISGRLLIINAGLTKGADKGQGPGVHAEMMKSLYPKKKKKQKQIVTFTIEEETAILNTAKGSMYPPLLLLFRSGMRLGEVLGLDFDSINFREQYIVVRQSFREKLLSGTKTGTIRNVPFGDDVLQMFKELRTKRNEARLKGVDINAVFLWKN